MITEPLWTRVKRILHRPIMFKRQPEEPSPMKHADEMLSTAIMDLSAAIKETKRRKNED